MKMFTFKVSDEPKYRKKFRYGEVIKIVYKNGDEIYGGQKIIKMSGRPNINDDIENVDSIVIESRFQKKPEEIYPDFLIIHWSFTGINQKAKAFLDENKIIYKILPIKIVNQSDQSYHAVFFNQQSDLIDLEQSNLSIDKSGRAYTPGKEYFNPILSKLVLKKEAIDINGIYALKESFDIVCNEKTKKSLEESGLTGFYFEEVPISESN